MITHDIVRRYALYRNADADDVNLLRAQCPSVSEFANAVYDSYIYDISGFEYNERLTLCAVAERAFAQGREYDAIHQNVWGMKVHSFGRDIVKAANIDPDAWEKTR